MHGHETFEDGHEAQYWGMRGNRRRHLHEGHTTVQDLEPCVCYLDCREQRVSDARGDI